MIADVFRTELFQGRVALVTGAGRGIGAGIAEAFLALGARTLRHDIDAAALGGAGRGGQDCIVGDLSQPGSADAVFDGALERAGRVDFLINNAGRSWAVGTEDIEPGRTQELIELNVKSVLALSRRLALHARERGGGGVDRADFLHRRHPRLRAARRLLRHQVRAIGLTKVLALDHAREGLRVNAVLPHVVETEMFRTSRQARGDRAVARRHSHGALRHRRRRR